MRRPFFYISLFLSGLMAVLCFLLYQSHREIYRQGEGSTVTVSGVICDMKDRGNSDHLVTISNLNIQAGSAMKYPDLITKLILRNPKALCYCNTVDGMKIGQGVVLEGTYSSFRSATNPGEFDQGRYYFSKGYLFSLKDAGLIHRGEDHSHFRHFLWEMKCSICRAFEECLDGESAGVMTAMFLGDRSGLTKELKEEYNETGIAHILAISGLHISILAAFLMVLLDRIPMRPYLRVVCLTGVLISYAVMVGLGVSVIRAMVCFLLRKIALLFGRSTDSLTNLGIASFITILICPAMLLSSSYLLSYLAVAGIALLSEDFLSRKFPLEHPVWNRILSGFAITFITLPVIMGTYYSVPVYSIPLNLLVLPFVPYLFGCGGGMLLFYYLGKGISGVSLLCNARIIGVDICQGLCKLCAFFIQSILAVFRMMNSVSLSLPHGRIVTGARPVWRVVVFLILVAILAYVSGKVRKRIYRGYLRTEIAFKLERKEFARERRGLRKQEIRFNILLGCMVSCLVIFLFLPCHKGFRVTFLDVGQGDGIMIEDGRRTYVIDGGSSSRNELGKYVLIPALEYRGIDKVEGWFVTHPDKDHISGLMDVIDDGRIEIDCIYVPDCLKGDFIGAMESAGKIRDGLKRPEIKGLYQGEMLSDGKISFTVLSPQAEGLGEDSNGNSLVLLMEKKGFQFLFMGDAGEGAERKIMEEWNGNDGTEMGKEKREEDQKESGRKNEGEMLKVDVLKVGHHGSAVNTNGEEFLSFIKSKVAVISCGANNRYGHPHEETLERLEKAGAYIFRTDESGAVTVKVKGGKMEVIEFLD